LAHRIVKPTPLTCQPPPFIELHATGSSDERNAKTFDKRWIFREPLINLKSYGLRDAINYAGAGFRRGIQFTAVGNRDARIGRKIIAAEQMPTPPC
jgi:hypothetical protein